MHRGRGQVLVSPALKMGRKGARHTTKWQRQVRLMSQQPIIRGAGEPQGWEAPLGINVPTSPPEKWTRVLGDLSDSGTMQQGERQKARRFQRRLTWRGRAFVMLKGTATVHPLMNSFWEAPSHRVLQGDVAEAIQGPELIQHFTNKKRRAVYALSLPWCVKCFPCPSFLAASLQEFARAGICAVRVARLLRGVPAGRGPCTYPALCHPDTSRATFLPHRLSCADAHSIKLMLGESEMSPQVESVAEIQV